MQIVFKFVFLIQLYFTTKQMKGKMTQWLPLYWCTLALLSNPCNPHVLCTLTCNGSTNSIQFCICKRLHCAPLQPVSSRHSSHMLSSASCSQQSMIWVIWYKTTYHLSEYSFCIHEVIPASHQQAMIGNKWIRYLMANSVSFVAY